ncbi:hypothetical protein POM88_044920 [Heracleum sosnowskyi]|uniref:Ankyrin repeat protein n=1 Tax=Heracleum sosnowskyi TaxID=360622 RepID=A0AAD8H644_9APIA|nr:hypothetical protein POM88_044920 [Heracleum sosnowskyi]
MIMEVGDPQMLRTSNCYGTNILHYAAKVGNTQAARVLVSKDPEIAQFQHPIRHTALKLAAWHGHRETLCYLLEVTKDVYIDRGISPYQDEDGADLLTLTITAGFYDVALYLVNMYPDLVTQKNNISSQTGLETLAAKPNAFQSGSKLGFWQQIIYPWIPVNREKALESPILRPSQVVSAQNLITKASYCLNFSFWSVLQYFAPHIKQMHDTKVKHIYAEELVKQMCATVINKGDHAIAWDVLGTALSTAATHGIHELTEQCIHHYPGLIYYDGIRCL